MYQLMVSNFKQTFGLIDTKPTFKGFYFVEKYLIEEIPMFGSRRSKLDDAEENNFLQYLARLKAGKTVLLLSACFEGATLVVFSLA